ncbi:MAG: spore maturation protein [Deltaproteobacteria bacterium]|nr:spore maturation protein [Deltaproteobacteria bacterium]
MSINESASTISNLILLVFLVGIPVYGALKGVKVYETFVEGAKQGFDIAVNIIPYLVAILVAVGMFRSSGAMDILTSFIPSSLKDLGITSDIVALALTRPLSGAASLGILGEIVSSHGADSYQAKLGSVILGSTETTLYVVAVYFGAVSITKTKYAIHAGLVADLIGVIASVTVCRIIFG